MGSTYMARAPSKASKSWERSAKLVKNTTKQNQYLEHIRQLHEPELQLKTLEDEIKGTMGKALGKQADKILMYTRLMEEQYESYSTLKHRIKRKMLMSMEEDSYQSETQGQKQQYQQQLLEVAKTHNEFRRKAIHARWELIVHRQAVGFIVGNQALVHQKFPIRDALPEEEHVYVEDVWQNIDQDGSHSTKPKAVFTDQLDWWQRIGRWK